MRSMIGVGIYIISARLGFRTLIAFFLWIYILLACLVLPVVHVDSAAFKSSSVKMLPFYLLYLSYTNTLLP